MMEDTKLFSAMATTLFLTGLGYLIITKLSVFKDILSIDVKNDLDISRDKYTVYLPDIWIPYQPFDSEESITQQFSPIITAEGDYFVIRFKSIRTTVDGIISEYTPEAIKVPLKADIDLKTLSANIVPVISSTVSPVGWSIKFPKFTVQLT